MIYLKDLFKQHFRVLLGGTVLFLTLWLVGRELKQYTLAETLQAFSSIPLSRLLVACLITALDYVFIASGDFLGLLWLKCRLFSTYSFAVAAAGNAIWCNAGIIAGSTAKYRFYSYLGLSAFQIASLLTFSSLSYFLGLFFLGGLTSLAEFFQSYMAGVHLIVSTESLIRFSFLLAVILYLFVPLFGRRDLSIGRYSITVPPFWIALMQVFLASMDWFLAGTVLYILMPPGSPLDLLQVIGTYVIAQITVLISQVPGGAGVFEGMVFLMLSSQIKGNEVLGTLIAFRMIFSVFPLITASCFWVSHEFSIRKGILDMRLPDGEN